MSTMQSRLDIVFSTVLVVSDPLLKQKQTITFSDYGNEVQAGQGIARAIKDGLVKREELFVVTKIWNTFHDRERVEPICRRQLKDWGLEYFDLFIMHFRTSLSIAT